MEPEAIVETIYNAKDHLGKRMGKATRENHADKGMRPRQLHGQRRRPRMHTRERNGFPPVLIEPINLGFLPRWAVPTWGGPSFLPRVDSAGAASWVRLESGSTLQIEPRHHRRAPSTERPRQRHCGAAHRDF